MCGGPRSSQTCAGASTSTSSSACSRDLEADGLEPTVIFLEADERTLVDRFKETRRGIRSRPRAG